MFRKGTHLVLFPIYWVYSTHILCNELTQTLKKWEKNEHTMFLSTKILWPTYPSKANDKGIMLSYLPRRRGDFDNRWNTVYVNRVCFVGTYMLITDIYGIFSLYRSQLSFIVFTANLKFARGGGCIIHTRRLFEYLWFPSPRHFCAVDLQHQKYQHT